MVIAFSTFWTAFVLLLACFPIVGPTAYLTSTGLCSDTMRDGIESENQLADERPPNPSADQ